MQTRLILLAITPALHDMPRNIIQVDAGLRGMLMLSKYLAGPFNPVIKRGKPAIVSATS